MVMVLRSAGRFVAGSTFALALVGAACSDDPTNWNDYPGTAGASGAGGSSSSGSSSAGAAGSTAGSGGSGGARVEDGAGSSFGGHSAGAGGAPGGSDSGAAGAEPSDPGDGGQPPVEAGGGAGGQAGGGGESPVEDPGSNHRLGQSCINDQQCGPDLQCLTATSGVLGGGSPPKGLCSKPCTDDDTCAALGTGALCFPFGTEAGSSYCMEGCAFGDPASGVKCHDRPELACLPALLGATNEPCSFASDCEAGEVCSDGACNVVFPACLPSCRGDLDCEDGLYCDQSFLGGTCVSQKPVGKKLGEPCTVPGPQEPAEPDGCIGFCQADSGDSNAGHCATTCGIGYECGWDSVTQKFGGACLYPSSLTEGLGGLGDFGFCTPACNCTEECGTDLACLVLEAGPLSSDFAGPGLCFAPDPVSDELALCP